MLTTSTEHKGVNTRFMCAIGWTTNHHKRPYPQNPDLRIVARDKLVERYKKLMGLVSHPAGFVAEVFGSDNALWVDRCKDIIAEVPEA